MKKLLLIISLGCLIGGEQVKAIEPISMTLATAIALPLAKAALTALVGQSNPKTCKPECFQGGSFCAGSWPYRNYRDCKGTCQRIVQYGDYQLRVRFNKNDGGGEESLQNCVDKGVKASGREKIGKEKKSRAVELKKSIAVYSSHVLSNLLVDVYTHETLKILTVSDNAYLKRRYAGEIAEAMKKTGTGKTIDGFLDEAKSNAKVQMEEIERQIENQRVAGIYGPQ